MARKNKRLPEEIKLFITKQLACFESPTATAKAVKEEYGLEISRQKAEGYDPTKALGRTLSKKLVAVFEATRKQFLEDTSRIPIAQQPYRLQSLQRMHDKARDSGNIVVAASLLEQAAKEVGGAYTDRRRIGNIPGEGPFKTEVAEAPLTDAELEKIARGGT